MKRAVLLPTVVTLGALLSCGGSQTPGTIIFPQDGALIRSPLRAEAQGPGQWHLDGTPVGQGLSLELPVTPGSHSLSYGQSRVNFTVRDERASGTILPVTEAVTLTPPQTVAVMAGQTSVQMSSAKNLRQTDTQHTPLRPQPPGQLAVRAAQAIRQGARPATRTLRAQHLPSQRTFRMNDLQGAVINVEADLIGDSGQLTIWADRSASVEQRQAALDTAQTFETTRRGLMEASFGLPSDVDGDGRVHLLFSPQLNAAGAAVGFFDPSDLLDPSVAGGNGMELLYLGLPDDSFNYSPASLLATTCHEYQHLVNFARKTLPPLYSGQLITETVAVNEGLSHLAEDLCGLNVSGGNAAFVAAALDANGTGSFAGADAQGETDTAARRGLAYLHLRRMLNEQRDPSGFLRRIINSRQTGWDNVSAQAETVRPALSDLQRTVWAMELAGTDGAPTWADFSGQPGPGPDTPGINPRQGWTPVWKNLGVNLRGPTPLNSWPQRLPAFGFAVRTVSGTFTPPAGAVSQRRIP